MKVSANAGVPTTPENPDPLRNGLGALVIGLMLGVGLAFLLEYLYLSGLRSPEKVEQVSGARPLSAPYRTSRLLEPR